MVAADRALQQQHSSQRAGLADSSLLLSKRHFGSNRVLLDRSTPKHADQLATIQIGSTHVHTEICDRDSRSSTIVSVFKQIKRIFTTFFSFAKSKEP